MEKTISIVTWLIVALGCYGWGVWVRGKQAKSDKEYFIDWLFVRLDEIYWTNSDVRDKILELKNVLREMKGK